MWFYNRHSETSRFSPEKLHKKFHLFSSLLKGPGGNFIGSSRETVENVSGASFFRSTFVRTKTSAMPLLALIGSAFFCVPLITAFFARSLGRPFWRWFGIGCILPFVSVIILWFLPEVKEEDRAADPFLSWNTKK